MKVLKITGIALAGMMVLAAQPATAKCLTKGAVATAGSETWAKWFAMETMVQSVSWGIWPAFVADGSTPGWKVTKEKYRCKKDGASITCRSQATFCPTKK